MIFQENNFYYLITTIDINLLRPFSKWRDFYYHGIPMDAFSTKSCLFIQDNDNADLEPLPRTDLEGFGGQDDLIAGKLIHPPIQTDNQQEFNVGIISLVDKTAKLC